MNKLISGPASLSRYSSTDKDSLKAESNLRTSTNDSSDLDGDDEDRLVIADDEDSKRDPISLKENVLNLKSDKPRKKHLRFNGMSEEEVAKRQLPDLLKENLDILIVSLFFYTLWKKSRVKKHHSTLEMDAFKVMLLLSYLASLDNKPRT